MIHAQALIYRIGIAVAARVNEWIQRVFHTELFSKGDYRVHLAIVFLEQVAFQLGSDLMLSKKAHGIHSAIKTIPARRSPGHGSPQLHHAG